MLIDFSDYNRARRNVLICSISILLVSSATITSSKMSILGLEFLISQTKLVAALQIALSFLFAVYCLYTLGRTPRLIMREIYRFDRAWEKKTRKEVQEMYRARDPDYEPWSSPYDDDDGYLYLGLATRRSRRATIFTVGYYLDRMVTLIVSFGVPVAFFSVAFFCPNFLRNLIGN